MFGQMLFAELPFASMGNPPYVERGWIKDCAEKNVWAKQDKAESQWSIQTVNRAHNWQKKDKNEVNTIGCGYVPTNMGKKE
jgi:hypothetical protein